MCTNATKTAAELMQAIEPTIKNLLTETNLINTPDAKVALTEYDAALTALQNWTPGTASQTVLEVIEDFQTGFNALPIPTNVSVLTNIILAGVETVIGVVTANSPAPTAPVATAETSGIHALLATEDVQVMHQTAVIGDTTAKVQALVPGFKRSIWHSPKSQYTGTWNKAVDDGSFNPALKVA